MYLPSCFVMFRQESFNISLLYDRKNLFTKKII